MVVVTVLFLLMAATMFKPTWVILGKALVFLLFAVKWIIVVTILIAVLGQPAVRAFFKHIFT